MRSRLCNTSTIRQDAPGNVHDFWACAVQPSLTGTGERFLSPMPHEYFDRMGKPRLRESFIQASTCPRCLLQTLVQRASKVFKISTKRTMAQGKVSSSRSNRSKRRKTSSKSRRKGLLIPGRAFESPRRHHRLSVSRPIRVTIFEPFRCSPR
jgi:hypothetical protein